MKLKPIEAPEILNIVDLFFAETGRKLSSQRIQQQVRDYPSLCAIDDRGLVLGFIYSGRFAPDILELMNLYIRNSDRSQGWGSQLIKTFEANVLKDGQYRAIILVNSCLYESQTTDRPATDFYLKHGYSLCLNTGDSRVFSKTFT